MMCPAVGLMSEMVLVQAFKGRISISFSWPVFKKLSPILTMSRLHAARNESK